MTQPPRTLQSTQMAQTAERPGRAGIHELSSNQVRNNHRPTAVDARTHQRTMLARSGMPQSWQLTSVLGFGTKRPRLGGLPGWLWPLFGRTTTLNAATQCAPVSDNLAGQQ